MAPLTPRVAVVTGAGRGIGRAIAHRMSATGAEVIAVARNDRELRETASGAPGTGRITPYPCDVGDPPQVERLFADVDQTYGTVDLLICSHGIYQGGVGALDLDLAQYDLTMNVNARACLHCAQLAGRSMRDGGRGGRIVFISSMNAIASQSGAVDYDTSKAALGGLTRALAVELAPHRITVNAIAPGWVRTPMSESELVELEREGMVMNPLGRSGDPSEIALAVAWLCDPGNRYTTGATIPVDGGQLAMLPMPWRPAERAGS